LPHLKEIEMVGFSGKESKDHEHDFLRFISKCSPMLKRVVVRLAYRFEGCAAEIRQIYNIFLVYPSVNCYVYSLHGDLVQPGAESAPS
jgi:hypothetical protein